MRILLRSRDCQLGMTEKFLEACSGGLATTLKSKTIPACSSSASLPWSESLGGSHPASTYAPLMESGFTLRGSGLRCAAELAGVKRWTPLGRWLLRQVLRPVACSRHAPLVQVEDLVTRRWIRMRLKHLAEGICFRCCCWKSSCTCGSDRATCRSAKLQSVDDSIWKHAFLCLYRRSSLN